MQIIPGSWQKDHPDQPWDTALITHGKKSIEFPLSFYGRLKEGERVFRDFNNYLAWFGKVNPAKVDELFGIYEKIKEATSSIFGTDENHSEVHSLCRQCLDIVTLESVSLWLRHDENIITPDIPEDKGSGYNPDQTYNLHEYNEMVKMTIVFKALVPTWGAYTTKMKKALPGTTEERLLSLIKSTDLEQSEAFKRFRVFVDTITSGKLQLAGVLDGISTTTLPKRCFAIAVVNRLAIMDLTWESDLATPGSQVVSIVANTHRFIRNQIDGINRGEMQTGAKVFRDKQSGEEDNTSIAENYTIKEDVPEVTKVFFDYYGKGYEQIAPEVYSEVDMKKVRDLVSYNQSRRNFIPTEVQYKLVGILLAQQIGVKSLPYTERVAAINLISIAQAVAIELGFPNIAALMGATPLLDDDFEPTVYTNKILRTQVRQHQLAELNQYYSYKKKNKSARSPYKNPAEIAIDILSGQFAHYVWIVSMPEDLMAEVTLDRDPDSDGWIVREDFRSELADFIIAINREIYKKRNI